ncbi:hypothetical protein TNCV_3492421 [Trichonephila clavipes]|nr:hypothetical protein TNCV_3492421 [Trichonephila clavipes]
MHASADLSSFRALGTDLHAPLGTGGSKFITAVGSLVVRASDSKPEGLGHSKFYQMGQQPFSCGVPNQSTDMIQRATQLDIFETIRDSHEDACRYRK